MLHFRVRVQVVGGQPVKHTTEAIKHQRGGQQTINHTHYTLLHIASRYTTTACPAQSGARPRWLRFSITGIRRALQHRVIVAGRGGYRAYTHFPRSLSQPLQTVAQWWAQCQTKSALGGILYPKHTHIHTHTVSAVHIHALLRSIKAPTH